MLSVHQPVPMLSEKPTVAPLQSPKTSDRHIPALDGVRAIAIFAVLIFHYFQQRPVATAPLDIALRKLTNLGSGGVDLFFVLSGFLITGILIDAKDSKHALRNFYMRRVLRIFPLYYGFLLVLFVVLPAAHIARGVAWSDQWWFWTYSSNLHDVFARRFPAGPEHFWSLAIEEQFYMVWPFLALRYPVRRLAQICGGMIVGAVVARAAVEMAGYNPYYFTLGRMDALASGALLACLVRLPGGEKMVRVWGHKLLIWLTPVIAGAYLLMSGRANSTVQIVKYTLVAALCTAAMVFAINARRSSMVSKVLTHKMLRSIGKYSYGMYVLHPAIIYFVLARTLAWPIAITLPLTAGISYGAAWCVWHVWEQPFLRLKKLFPSREGVAG